MAAAYCRSSGASGTEAGFRQLFSAAPCVDAKAQLASVLLLSGQRRQPCRMEGKTVPSLRTTVAKSDG
jgi:hypothetical protein